jgi:hypothetical protein
MDELVYRCGFIAALRSISLNGSIVGLMLTASHNPVEVVLTAYLELDYEHYLIG